MHRSFRARKVLTLVLVLVFVSMVCVPATAETWNSREATEALGVGEALPVEVLEPPAEEATGTIDEQLPVHAEAPTAASAIAASAYLDAFEDDDIIAQARPITLGAPQSHTIHVLGDEDWVKFDVVAGGRYRIETLPGDTWFDTEIYVYASDGTTLLDSDNDSGYGGTFSAIDLAPSTSETVYVGVASPGDTSVGAYRLSVTGGPFGPDAYEADDSMATASTITLDAPAQERTFHVTSDDDYASVDLVAGQDYVFRTLPGDADLDTVLYLYDSNGVEEGYSDDDGTDYYSTIYYTPTTSGTYYLLARPYAYSYTGRYLLEATAGEAGDAYEVDDSPASAKPITTDGTRQDRSFHVVDDLDYVSFQAVAGVEYQVETHEITAGLDTEMYVYDSDGTTEIAYNDDGGYSYMSYIEFTADETETLYVLAHSYDLDETGEYALTVVSLAPDAYEVDDTSAEAKQILPGVGQQRTFHQDVDPDWAKLDVVAGLDYTITTRAGSDVDTVMYLYDTDGTTELDYDDDSGPAYFSHIEYSATESKTVYIMVRGYWKGAYQLDVECNDLTPPVTTANALATYNVSATISLAASDPAPGVGVAATYYMLDGAAKQVYGGPITVGAAGTHTLQYWSVDKVTNEESVKSATFQVIAAKPPATTPRTSSTGTTTASAEATTVASLTTTPTVPLQAEDDEAEEESGDVELKTTSAGELGEEPEDVNETPFLGWMLGVLLIVLMIGGVAAFARKK